MLNIGNVGEGLDALRAGTWIGGTPKPKLRGGFFLGAGVGRKQALHPSRYLKHAEGHETSRKNLIRRRALSDRPLRANDLAIRWRSKIERHGLRAAFLLSPILSDAKMATSVPGGAPLLFFDFNDPQKYPELYDVQVRHDRSHLGYAGAVLFSNDFADALADVLDAPTAKR
jgi:hypothetical protein